MTIRDLIKNRWYLVERAANRFHDADESENRDQVKVDKLGDEYSKVFESFLGFVKANQYRTKIARELGYIW